MVLLPDVLDLSKSPVSTLLLLSLSCTCLQVYRRAVDAAWAALTAGDKSSSPATTQNGDVSNSSSSSISSISSSSGVSAAHNAARAGDVGSSAPSAHAVPSGGAGNSSTSTASAAHSSGSAVAAVESMAAAKASVQLTQEEQWDLEQVLAYVYES